MTVSSELFQVENLNSQVYRIYQDTQELLVSQSAEVRQLLDEQARLIGKAVLERSSRIQFTLPASVTIRPGLKDPMITAPRLRSQHIFRTIFLQKKFDISQALLKKLENLGKSDNAAVVISAHLLRHCTAVYLLQTLPDGHPTNYTTPDGEEIASIPAAKENRHNPLSEITSAKLSADLSTISNAFFLPQWLAFDEQNNLLVGSLDEAEAVIGLMVDYMRILRLISNLAPHIQSDPVYQRKQYGISGQLVNQGRALARAQNLDTIQIVLRREKNDSLNRGLSISIRYYNDQENQMEWRRFEVTPTGWIPFAPSFVVRAAWLEIESIAQDARLNATTRKHLVKELQILESAFKRPAKSSQQNLR